MARLLGADLATQEVASPAARVRAVVDASVTGGRTAAEDAKKVVRRHWALACSCASR